MQMLFDAASGRLTENSPATLQPPAGTGPRHLDFHPSGDIVYLLNELDATITTLALNRTNGRLRALHNVAMLPPGFAGEPWGADLHLSPDGRILYSSERRSSTLAAFRIDTDTRALNLLGHITTEPQPRGFNLDPSGRWLVVAGQVSNRVTVYAINPHSSMPETRASVGVGNNPNWIEIVALS